MKKGEPDGSWVGQPRDEYIAHCTITQYIQYPQYNILSTMYIPSTIPNFFHHYHFNARRKRSCLSVLGRKSLHHSTNHWGQLWREGRRGGEREGGREGGRGGEGGGERGRGEGGGRGGIQTHLKYCNPV